jgi:hypothetical protein
MTVRQDASVTVDSSLAHRPAPCSFCGGQWWSYDTPSTIGGKMS